MLKIMDIGGRVLFIAGLVVLMLWNIGVIFKDDMMLLIPFAAVPGGVGLLMWLVAWLLQRGKLKEEQIEEEKPADSLKAFSIAALLMGSMFGMLALVQQFLGDPEKNSSPMSKAGFAALLLGMYAVVGVMRLRRARKARKQAEREDKRE